MTDPEREPEHLVAELIHEIRHPLLAIKLGLGSVQESVGAALTAADDWPIVLAQLARLEELLKTYQQFVSPDGLKPSLFDVGPVVRSNIDAFQPQLKKLGAHFIFQLPGEPLQVFGTPSALSHALTNVLSNACDAVEPMGPNGRIEVRVLPGVDGDRTEIRVSDTGTGISPEASERLFEPGFTTKPRGKGTGLGLAIARRAMAAISGEVAAVPPGGPGRLPWAVTEMRISFRPSENTRKSSPPPRVAPLAQARAPVEGGGPRVLLIEDDAVICGMLKRGLERNGFTVESAGTGEEAIALFRQAPFQAVVTDKNLPGLSGLDVARAVRADHPDVALVMMTGYASIESARRLQQLTGDEYLPKPFELEALVTAVKMALERRKNRRAAETVDAPKRRDFGAPRRVLVVDPVDEDRARLMRVLGDLKCVPLRRENLARALEEIEACDALVMDGALLTDSARLYLRDLRARRPDFRVVLIASSETLMHSMDCILLEAGDLMRPWKDDQAAMTLKAAFVEPGERT